MHTNKKKGWVEKGSLRWCELVEKGQTTNCLEASVYANSPCAVHVDLARLWNMH